MIRTERQFSKKWEEAVKRAFSYTAFIDDIIEVTITVRNTKDVAPLIADNGKNGRTI